MTDLQEFTIKILLNISVVFFTAPILYWVLKWAFLKIHKRTVECRKKSAVGRMLWFSLWLMLAVGCMRYAAGYYCVASGADQRELLWLEQIFKSITEAIQTISADIELEDYLACLLNDIWSEYPQAINFYRLYSYAMNAIAPIVGGATFLTVLTNIFPKIKHTLLGILPWTKKYYFSELNAGSFALAKSICSACSSPRCIFSTPLIIFTDVYKDDEEEKEAELLMHANAMGAICLKEDMTHISKFKIGGKKLFLIDENESDNLHTLTKLTESPANAKRLKKTEIYLFVNTDAYVQVEAKVMDALRKIIKEKKLPIIIPVKEYRNLVSNLLVDIPLYEPIVGSRGKKALMLTIVGNGKIGTEMFLSAYWIGQMLDCELKINIVSCESISTFRNKIDYINPEIGRTLMWQSENGEVTTFANNELLKIRDGEYAKPYGTVRYYECDVKSSEFMRLMTDRDAGILGTNYYFVALGSDEDNLSVANTVKKYVGAFNISNAEKYIPPAKTIITYVVYDSAMSDILNMNSYSSSLGNIEDIYMRAVGNQRDVYSFRNVFMTDHNSGAIRADNVYNSIQNKKERANAHKARLKDDYKYWASIANAMHLKYKMFSVGVINCSLFDADRQAETSPKDSRKKGKKELYELYGAYRELLFGDSADFKSRVSLHNRIAWLEHRRWCAFTRTMGFRQTQDYAKYAETGKIGSYKQMEIKLHPCLVECDDKGIFACCDGEGYIATDRIIFPFVKLRGDDMLDKLTYDLWEKMYNDYIFKIYDYQLPSSIPDVKKKRRKKKANTKREKENKKQYIQLARCLYNEWCGRLYSVAANSAEDSEKMYRLARKQGCLKVQVDANGNRDLELEEFDKLGEKIKDKWLSKAEEQVYIALCLGYKLRPKEA